MRLPWVLTFVVRTVVSWFLELLQQVVSISLIQK